MSEIRIGMIASTLIICLTLLLLKNCDHEHELELKCLSLGDDGHYYLNDRCWLKGDKEK